MKKSAFQKMLPWLCLLIIVGIMVVLQRVPERKQEDGTVIMPGSGYREIAENDGILYMVESSGHIYTMDWETGEKELLFSAPSDVEWVSDPSVSSLYYILGGTLCRTYIPSAKEEMLWDVKGVFEILTVTENDVLYLHWTQDPEKPYDIWCVDVETMEAFCILSAEELVGNENTTMNVYAVPGEGDVAYVLFRNPSLVEYPDRSRYWLEKWDLNTGERTFLTETDKYCSFLCDGSDYDGMLYYQQEDGIWMVPNDGNGEGTRIWQNSGDVYFGVSVLCEDGKIIVGDHSIVLIDLSNGKTITGGTIVYESITDICTNGNRIALRYRNSKAYIALMDVPSE